MLQTTWSDDDLTLIARPAAAASTASDVTHTLIVSDDEGVQQRVPVSAVPLTIGRVPPSDLVLADSSVSRTHCQVRLIEGQAMAADLRSTNGTFVDGRRIAEATPLQHGSVLQVGSFTLLYERRTRSEIEETAAIERDLQGASTYVQRLLPRPLLAGPVLANWMFLPCAQLGGSAFGYRFLNPGCFTGYIIDVAGQGMGAAMHSVAVMNLLRQPSIPGTDLADPGAVLNGLNAMFRPEDHNGVFFSIWYFAFDLQTLRLSYASAGHHPGFLVSPDRRAVAALEGDGPAIGLQPDHHFVAEAASAAPGSTLYLVSNGVREIMEGGAERGGLQRLIGADVEQGVPEPLRLYHAVRAVGPEALEENFSAVTCIFA